MRTNDFDYQFPDSLIAHLPAERRDHSRLMVLNRERQTIEHRAFYQVIDYLESGDLLVLNDTKVIPANLVGRKEEGGARVEVLLVNRKQKAVPIPYHIRFGIPQSGKREKQEAENREQKWECLVKPGKRLNVGSRVVFGDGELVGTVLEKTESGEQIIEFEAKGDFWEIVNRLGEMPLPPYIKRTSKYKDQSSKQATNQKQEIQNRYQTVYAVKEGASAAPTAGLHFTKELLEKIQAKGVKIAYLTLHTGLATFKPVYAEKVEDHTMYSEYFEIPAETIEEVNKAKRVIAVGTTSVRALESGGGEQKAESRKQKAESRTQNAGVVSGETNIFIYPGYKFKVIDALITNFHWPKSTLIMLVSAFAGKDFVFRAYEEAIKQEYRFFSFGDAMLIL